MAAIFCSSANVKAKIKNLSADIDNGDTVETDVWIADAESVINCVCRYNFSDTYATLNADTKQILRAAASDYACIMAITYDMSGFTSRVEAEDMINILRDDFLRCIAILRDKKTVEFINDG